MAQYFQCHSGELCEKTKKENTSKITSFNTSGNILMFILFYLKLNISINEIPKYKVRLTDLIFLKWPCFLTHLTVIQKISFCFFCLFYLEKNIKHDILRKPLYINIYITNILYINIYNKKFYKYKILLILRLMID